MMLFFFFFQAEDGIRDYDVTGVQTCALPIYGLDSTPVQEEHYDFVVPKNRRDRPAVVALCELLADAGIRRRLTELGFRL